MQILLRVYVVQQGEQHPVWGGWGWLKGGGPASAYQGWENHFAAIGCHPKTASC